MKLKGVHILGFGVVAFVQRSADPAKKEENAKMQFEKFLGEKCVGSGGAFENFLIGQERHACIIHLEPEFELLENIMLNVIVKF